MSQDFRPPVPILRSFDEAKAREFYIDFLGFEVGFEFRFEPDTPLYMGVQKGACELHISEHFGDAAPGASMRIDVPDVHAYCAELNAKRYRHARPGVQRQPWGMDDMTIADPFGNRLIFCTAVPEGG
ncbi:MAG: VOC family protein [Rhodobacteraceae bacterium]|nr:VOC family protein [Paracoccaceae bacterium]